MRVCEHTEPNYANCDQCTILDLQDSLTTLKKQKELVVKCLGEIEKGISCLEEDGTYSVAPRHDSRELAREAIALLRKDGL